MRPLSFEMLATKVLLSFTRRTESPGTGWFASSLTDI